MGKGKLILICQCGGEFEKNDDGSLTYAGGEAHAVNVNCKTLFDDLKLKLAEMCNLEYGTMSIKYFLPGNTRTLITLANDKDLKRMLDFHVNSVTAEVFLKGNAGFSPVVLTKNTIREAGIKVADSVNRDGVVSPTAAATSSPVDAASPAGTPARVATRSIAATKKATPTSRVATRSTAATKKATPTSRVATRSTAATKNATPTSRVAAKKATPATRKTAASKKATPVARDSDRSPTGSNTSSNDSVFAESDDFSGDWPSSPVNFADKKFSNSSLKIDKSASPADTVKKRRRTASWKIGANGPTIVAVPGDDDDDDGDKRSRKKNSRILFTDDDLEQKKGIVSGKNKFETSRRSKSSDMPLEKLISSWKVGITGIGQDFKNVYEFRDALQKYAIAHRFVYRLKKNDSTFVSGTCAVENCSWRIHAAWVSSAQSFRIKEFDPSHTCEGESWKSVHPAKNWLVNIIKDRLLDSPHQKPKDIANGILRDFGIELTYTQVWRRIVDTRGDIHGTYHEAYDQLSGYCQNVMETNPGSIAKFVTGDDKRFQCLFISFHSSIHGFQKGCRPLLFLEGTSLKSKYHEVLLTATALDGDDGFFPVAFAIVDVESDDKWHWFLEQLKSALPTSESITFVSEREKGLKELVLNVFENAHLGYSMFHLLENFQKILKGPFHGDGKGSLSGYFVSAAHAVRLAGFRKFTEQIKQVSSQAYDLVMQIEPEYWTTTSFKGERHNHIVENVAEPYIKLMEEAEECTITQKIDTLILMTTDLIKTRQTESSKWSTKLTPSKTQKLQEETGDARGLKVFISSETVFEVRDDVSHVVNLNSRDCTCLVWQTTGLPCRHAIAVFNHTRKNVYDYCSTYFTADIFRLTYSASINPVLGVDKAAEKEEESVLPPCPSRSSSQRRHNKLKEED